MSHQQPTGPFCQSCGMPLGKPEDFGTDITGYRVNDYCHFCFRNGAFTEPQVSMQAMIDKCVDIMAKGGIMPEAQARTLMTDVIPKLKRWRVMAGAV
ncbi:MAG TPA: zinc ribbon domain-containing protein [Gemmatimonadales bacterium]|nr:zinc ribbon domain-containing protein [Gemmatimonadales bacterium]